MLPQKQAANNKVRTAGCGVRPPRATGRTIPPTPPISLPCVFLGVCGWACVQSALSDQRSFELCFDVFLFLLTSSPSSPSSHWLRLCELKGPSSRWLGSLFSSQASSNYHERSKKLNDKRLQILGLNETSSCKSLSVIVWSCIQRKLPKADTILYIIVRIGSLSLHYIRKSNRYPIDRAETISPSVIRELIRKYFDSRLIISFIFQARKDQILCSYSFSNMRIFFFSMFIYCFCSGGK